MFNVSKEIAQKSENTREKRGRERGVEREGESSGDDKQAEGEMCRGCNSANLAARPVNTGVPANMSRCDNFPL